MFLEKFAKLTSKVNGNPNEFEVDVYDTESISDEPVMYLLADIRTSENEDKYLYVDNVNFDDEFFFQMPQSRQEKCALVLFKAFLKYYNEHFGKNSGNWLPVGADFQNYALQEKFKAAIDKGIFPKESTDFIQQVNKDDWEKDQQFNMDNRRNKNDFAKDPAKFFQGYNVVNKTIVDIPISELIKKVEEIDADYSLMNNVSGYLENGQFYLDLPNIEVNSSHKCDFEFNTSTKSIYFYSATINDIKQQLNNDVNKLKQIFDIVDEINIKTSSGRDLYDLEGFCEELLSDKVASTKRLQRKRG